MLNSILHAKSGRHGDEERVSWRDTFRAGEDHMTATFIERLSYLPGPTAMKLLREAARRDTVGDGADLFNWKVTEFESVDFWPRWPAAEKDKSSIEPDVFIRWKVGDPERTFDLIVEAKQDHARQWAGQWQDQLRSYTKRLEEEDAERADILGVLALGGKVGDLAVYSAAAREALDGALIAWVSWADVARAVTAMKPVVSPAEARILSDLEKALAFFGFVHVSFDDSLKRLHRLPKAADLKLETLSEWK